MVTFCVGVGVGVDDGFGVGVCVGTGVGVTDGFTVGVGVAVGCGVAVAVGVCVGAAVGLGVSVGDGTVVAFVAVNVVTLLFHVSMPFQFALNIPTFTMYVPCAAGVQSNTYDFTVFAVKFWFS